MDKEKVMSRLLADGAIRAIQRGMPLGNTDFDNLKRGLKFQDAKTASIKDAECQARVERIFREIKDMRGDSNLMTPWGNSFDINWEQWRDLKGKEGVK